MSQTGLQLDPKQILHDPEFRKLPRADQHSVLSTVDQDFGKLSPEDQDGVLGSIAADTTQAAVPTLQKPSSIAAPVKPQQTPKLQPPTVDATLEGAPPRYRGPAATSADLLPLRQTDQPGMLDLDTSLLKAITPPRTVPVGPREPGHLWDSRPATPEENAQYDTAHPVKAGLREFAEGMATPRNIGLALGTAGFGPIAQRLVAGVFTEEQLRGAQSIGPQILESLKVGDKATAKKLLTQYAATLGMSVLTGVATGGGRTAESPAGRQKTALAAEVRPRPAVEPVSPKVAPIEAVRAQPQQTNAINPEWPKLSDLPPDELNVQLTRSVADKEAGVQVITPPHEAAAAILGIRPNAIPEVWRAALEKWRAENLDETTTSRPQVAQEPTVNAEMRGAAPIQGVMPREAISASESGRPIAGAAGSPPGTQALSTQVSARAVPSAPRTTRTMEPSMTTGPSTSDVDTLLIPASIRRILHKSHDVNVLLTQAAEKAPALEQLFSDLSAQVPGIETAVRPQKALPRLMEKIEVGGRLPSQVSDYLAGRIAVENLDQYRAVVDRLRTRNVWDDDNFFATGKDTKGGYRSHNLQIDMGDGFTAEVQVVPSDILAHEKETHALYEVMRRPGASFEEVAAASAQASEINKASWDSFMQRELGRRQTAAAQPAAGQLPGRAVAQAAGETRMVQLTDLEPHPEDMQMRLGPGKYGTTPAQVDALTDSIRKSGFTGPIDVVRHPETGNLVPLNHHRLVAAENAGLSEIPVKVLDIPYEEAVRRAMKSNTSRNPLSKWEEARLFGKEEAAGASAAEIAKRHGGRKVSEVEGLLTLTKLPPELQDLVQKGQLEPNMGMALARAAERNNLSPELVTQFFNKIVKYSERTPTEVGNLIDMLAPAATKKMQGGFGFDMSAGFVDALEDWTKKTRDLNSSRKKMKGFVSEIASMERQGKTVTRAQRTARDQGLRLIKQLEAEVAKMARSIGRGATDREPEVLPTLQQGAVTPRRPSDLIGEPVVEPEIAQPTETAGYHKPKYRELERAGQGMLLEPPRKEFSLEMQGEPTVRSERIASREDPASLFGDEQGPPIAEAPERYQWMRNAEGGQKFGNQMELRKITRENFSQFVQSGLRDVNPGQPQASPQFVRSAEHPYRQRDFTAGEWDYDAFREAFPNVTHVSVFRNAGGPWESDSMGSLSELRNTMHPQWSLKVSDFSAPEALQFGNIADSEAATLGLTPKGATKPMFPSEMASPSPEAEAAYAQAAKQMRKTGGEPTVEREGFETNYRKELAKSNKRGGKNAATLYSNPIQAVMEAWSEGTGKAAWDFIERWTEKLQPEWMRRGTITNYGQPEEYVGARRGMNIRTAEGYEAAEKMGARMSKGLTQDEQQALTRMLQGEATEADVAGMRSDARWNDAVESYKQARTMTDDIGFQAVMQNLLKDETFFKNQGKYMPRLYRKWEVNYEGMAKDYGGKPTRLDLERFKKRGDIPEWVRMEMGEIKEAAYPFAKGYSQMVHDVELQKLFQFVADRPDWAATDMDTLWTAGKNPKDYVQMPETKKLGPLSGKWVNKYIADDINQTVRARSDWEKLGSNLLSEWKFGKVVLSPATQARNTMSNAVLAQLGGLPVTRVDVYYKGLRGAVTESPEFQQFKADGGVRGTFNKAEMSGLLDAWNGAPGGSLADRFHAMLKDVKEGRPLSAVGVGPTSRLGQKAGNLYQAEEIWFKFSKYLHNIERGMTSVDAVADAHHWLFDYSEVPKYVAWARKSPFGSPFITFTAKAIPRVAESIVRAPWRAGSIAATIYAINGIAQQQLGLSKEDMRRIEAVKPDRMRENIPGVQKYMLLPWKDNYGQIQYLDLTYILPWGDIGETQVQALQGVPFQPLIPLATTPVKALFEVGINHSSFTDKPIFKETDTGFERSLKVADYLWKTAAPNLAPGGYGFNRLEKAIMREPDYFGRISSIPTAAASTLLGLKTSPLDPQREGVFREREAQATLQDLEAQARAIMRSQAYSAEAKQRAIAKLRTKAQDFRAGLAKRYGREPAVQAEGARQ